MLVGGVWLLRVDLSSTTSRPLFVCRVFAFCLVFMTLPGFVAAVVGCCCCWLLLLPFLILCLCFVLMLHFISMYFSAPFSIFSAFHFFWYPTSSPCSAVGPREYPWVILASQKSNNPFYTACLFVCLSDWAASCLVLVWSLFLFLFPILLLLVLPPPPPSATNSLVIFCFVFTFCVCLNLYRHQLVDARLHLRLEFELESIAL